MAVNVMVCLYVFILSSQLSTDADGKKLEQANIGHVVGNPNSNVWIPIEHLQKINEIDSVYKFADEFIKNKEKFYEDFPKIRLSNRFIGEHENAADLAAKPICSPELTYVKLNVKEPRTDRMYMPTCTRIKKCGGCCLPPTVCKPKSVNTIKLSTIELTIDYSYVTYHNFTLEEHVSCDCIHDRSFKEKDKLEIEENEEESPTTMEQNTAKHKVNFHPVPIIKPITTNIGESFHPTPMMQSFTTNTGITFHRTTTGLFKAPVLLDIVVLLFIFVGLQIFMRT